MSDDRFQPHRIRRPAPIQTPTGLLIDLDDDEIAEVPTRRLSAAPPRSEVTQEDQQDEGTLL